MKNDMKFDFNLWWAKHSFSSNTRGRGTIYRRLSKMLTNSVPLGDAISELSVIALRHGPKHPTVLMYAAWLKEINSGNTLGSALSGWAPDDEVLLIASGEAGGKLPEMLARASENLEGKMEVKNALRSALAYPSTLLLSAAGLAWFFSSSIIPKFASVLPSDQWRGLAGVTLTASDFVRNWFFLCVFVVILIIIGLSMSLSRWAGRGRVKADLMFPWSVYRLMNGVSFMASLSAMISSDTSLRDALTKIEHQLRGNPYLKSRINAILREVRNGKDAGAAMTLTKHQFPDIDIIDELCIYGRYSGFDEVLSSISISWRKEGVDSIKRKAGVLFIVALLAMFGVVGFFSTGLFAIAHQVTDSVKTH